MTYLPNPLHRDGLSQAQRQLPALDPATAPLDGRAGQELLEFAAAYARAARVRFFPADGSAPDYTTWPDLMTAPGGQLLQDLEQRADNPPHLALFLAFLKLFGLAQAQLNAFTQRHLDFYYREVLRLRSRPAVPDQVHLTFELARTVAAHLLPAGTGFDASPDAGQQPQRYDSVAARLLNRAGLAGLRTIDLPAAADEADDEAAGKTDDQGELRLRYAPSAATADGVAAPLPADDPSWSAFGPARVPGWPAARVGFAVAAPVLRLAEGERRIRLHLTPLDAARLKTDKVPVLVQLSGAAGWIEVAGKTYLEPLSAADGDGQDGAGTFELDVTLPATEARAVVGYDPAVLDGGYATTAPVLRVLLPTAAAYHALADLPLAAVRVRVDVTGLRRSLALENDQGQLNPDKPFQLFGPVPVAGSALYVRCAETAGKCLTSLTARVTGWLGLPPNLAAYYAGYAGEGKDTFNPQDTLVALTTPQHEQARPVEVRLLGELDDAHGADCQVADAETRPQPFGPAAPEALLTVRLAGDFGHAAYPTLLSKYLSGRAGAPPTMPNPPYTPVAQGLEISYSATSGDLLPRRMSAADFERRPAQLLHQDVFGWAEEHAWLKNGLSFLDDAEIGVGGGAGTSAADGPPLGLAYLLPRLTGHGTFLLALRDAGPLAAVAVLLQVAEGSANPARPRAEVRWSVLGRNQWCPLRGSYAPVDATDGLLTSGIVEFSLPAAVTTDNTRLDAGLTWLKAELWADGQPAPADSVARLVGVHPQAVRARFVNQDNGPAHYAAPLPAGSVSRPLQSVAALKAVRQPYPGFGGRPAESPAAFYTRVSERLRHKQRAVTIWDYEHLVLEQFPAVARVQCLNHTRLDYAAGAAQLLGRAPGHVVLVAVPGPGYGYVATPLTPRLAPHTLSALAAYVGALAGPQVQVQATSPHYDPVTVTARVAFCPGYPPVVYLPRVAEELTARLAPWTRDPTANPAFGGTVQLSTVVAWLEQLPYVDFVTDVALAGGVADADAGTVTASAPGAVLTSAARHDLEVYSPDY